jgi:hypothetical protein
LPVSKPLVGVAAEKSGPTIVGSAASVVLAAGGAKALIAKTCGTGCHSTDVVTSQRMNGKEWNATVQNMIARGVHASDPEPNVIIKYLATKYGSS